MSDEQDEFEGTQYVRAECPQNCPRRLQNQEHWHWVASHEPGDVVTYQDLPPDRLADIEQVSLSEDGSGRSAGQMVEIILRNLMEQGGRLVITVDHDRGDPVVVGCEFGQEAEDSPMAGGASYGIGETPEQALATVLGETGWDRG